MISNENIFISVLKQYEQPTVKIKSLFQVLGVIFFGKSNDWLFQYWNSSNGENNIKIKPKDLFNNIEQPWSQIIMFYCVVKQ